jgi:hypothetical protein
VLEVVMLSVPSLTLLYTISHSSGLVQTK